MFSSSSPTTPPENIPTRRINLIDLRLPHPTQNANNPMKQIYRAQIAVVIQEYLSQSLRVTAYLLEEFYNEAFMFGGTVRTLEYNEENIGYENLNLRFK